MTDSPSGILPFPVRATPPAPRTRRAPAAPVYALPALKPAPLPEADDFHIRAKVAEHYFAATPDQRLLIRDFAAAVSEINARGVGGAGADALALLDSLFRIDARQRQIILDTARRMAMGKAARL
jgi:hypothetical protein